MSDNELMEIAQWAARRERDEGDAPSVTNMKAQKLAYLAESLYGYRTGDNLGETPFQAWEHGPVLPPLYWELKANKNAPLSPTAGGEQLSSDVQVVFEIIWDNFGEMTASQLREFTHEFGPYEKHFELGRRGIVIPSDEIHSAWRTFIDAVERRHLKESGVALSLPKLNVPSPIIGDKPYVFDNEVARDLLWQSRLS